MCCSSFMAEKRKFDGFSPYLKLSNQKIEESECQGDGCSVGDGPMYMSPQSLIHAFVSCYLCCI